MLPAPTAEEVERSLPTSLSLPITNLLSTVRTEPVVVPIPTTAIYAADIAIFREIMESDLFREYMLIHSDLEMGSTISELAKRIWMVWK